MQTFVFNVMVLTSKTSFYQVQSNLGDITAIHLDMIACETNTKLPLPAGESSLPSHTKFLGTTEICLQMTSQLIQTFLHSSPAKQTCTDHATCDTCRKGPRLHTGMCGPTMTITTTVASLVFSFLRTLTTWHCPHSLAIHCCCWAPAIQQAADNARLAHSS